MDNRCKVSSAFSLYQKETAGNASFRLRRHSICSALLYLRRGVLFKSSKETFFVSIFPFSAKRNLIIRSIEFLRAWQAVFSASFIVTNFFSGTLMSIISSSSLYVFRVKNFLYLDTGKVKMTVKCQLSVLKLLID